MLRMSSASRWSVHVLIWTFITRRNHGGVTDYPEVSSYWHSFVRSQLLGRLGQRTLSVHDRPGPDEMYLDASFPLSHVRQGKTRTVRWNDRSMLNTEVPCS